jgi:hypothetical protein
MKVIFLDIDGVLTTARTDYAFFDSACVRRLKHILRATDARIVVSSTWRRGRDVEALRDLFSKGGDYLDLGARPEPFDTSTIIGKTPNLSSEKLGRREANLSWGRGHEISTWLTDTYLTVDYYLVLDDDTADIPPHCDHQVVTDTDHGLLDEHIPEAIRILNTPT